MRNNRRMWMRGMSAGIFAAAMLLCSAAAPAASPATRSAADPLREAPSYGAALLHMVLVLGAIVVGLLVIAKALPRLLPALAKRRRAAGPHLIEVRDRLQLERNRWLYIVRVGQQQFLVSSAEGGVAMLGNIDPAAGQSSARPGQGAAAPESPQPSASPDPGPFLDVLTSVRGTVS